MAGKTYSTDEVMAMMQAPREDVQMLDKPASPFLDPAQINAAERELSDDPNFFVDATPAPQRPDGGNFTLYPSKRETQPSLPKPVYSTDEVMALYTNESKPVYSTKDVMKQMIAPLYDPTAKRPSRDEYFKLKEMEKSLKESGDIEDPGAFEISTKAIGGLLVTAKDALSSFFLDSNDTLKRSPATAALAGQMVAQNYNALSDGLRAMGGPKFRVKETGEFITNDFSNPGGTGEASPTSAIDFYKSQGMTLLPIGDEDLKDWEYQQWSKKMDRNLAIEKTRTAEIPPALLIPDGMPIEAEIEYRKLFDNVRANEAQATVGSIAGDPMTWATGGAGSTSRIGLSAAAKGATAETLGIMGKLAQKVVQPTEQALTKAEAFKKLVVSPAKVASAYGAASGVAWAADKLELPSELKTAAFTAASLYGAYKAGVGVLRFTANKLPEASVILRESANATNGFDVAARKAVAANADVPFSIRERLLRPSQFVAMESTPARLAKNMELSPGTRAMMDKLSNWYVVQGVRGASAVATGAVKGAAAGVPFAELMRSAGDDESAAAIYGMGAAFGSAGGAAERAFGARGRRFAQAESDVARFLTDVQGNTVNLKDVKRYQWINTEVGRLLTDVELGAGDVSALVKNRSFDELARTAAMQGFFRDRVDFVPLSAADFALNAKGHGADGSAGYFLNAPDGQRPRIFVNVEARRADVEPHEFYEAFFSSDAFSPEQKASMRAAVDQRYGADGLMARGREYAESLIKAENAKNFPNENLFVTSEQIAARMDQLAQDELGRGGQDALDWVRREVMVEEARMAGIDYAAMRRNVPAGQNPITFVENLLGANARALGLSGVRVDPETGMAVTPEQLFKENPVAAGDPKLVKQLNGYLKTYKQWLNDPQHETPKGTRIAPDGRAESLANNPNVKFYDGVNGKENSIAFVDASGRVIEKTPKQRAKERKLRGQQVRNMVGSKILEPSNTTFGLKRWADGRIRAGGKRLPDVMALQTHWKAHLPIIRSIEALSDAGESQQVLYFAKGNSADKVKSSRLGDIDAINREMVFDQWTTNAAGDLLAQFLDLTSVRNRAMKAIAERHPALDPANGGPGYSLQKIMDDVNQWMADKGAGKAGEATIGVPRKNVVNALINPGTNFNRGRNDLAGAFGRGSAIKTLLLEGINAVSGTGRKGAAMDYAWANGNFMPDKPAPRPNMDGDLAPPRTIKDLSTDQILRELEENQGYLGLSTLGMREGRPVKGGAQRTRELLRRNEELNAELRKRGGPQEESDVDRVLRQRGQAMPDTDVRQGAAETLDQLKRSQFIPTKVAAEVVGGFPEYLRPVAQFITDQRQKLANGQMTRRDVMKAYAMTVASQGSGARAVEVIANNVAKDGIRFRPSKDFTTVDKKGRAAIRPEEAAAYWLGTEAGQRALNNFEAGRFNPDDWKELVAIRKAYGDDRFNNLGAFNPKNIRTMDKVLADLNASRADTGKVMDAVQQLRGIKTGKKGFIAHLLGIGDVPTIDAVEINFWLTGKADIGKLNTRRANLARNIKKSISDKRVSQEMFRRIDQRINALRDEVPGGAEIAPEVWSHVMHHWLWDKSKGIETTHEGMYRAQAQFMPDVAVNDEGGTVWRTLQDAPVITLKDLKGRKVFAAFADLTSAGKIYRGIDSSEIAVPVETHGGPEWPLLQSEKVGEETNVWSNQGAGVSAIKARRANEGAIMLIAAMDKNAHVSNTETATAVIATNAAYARDGRITPENLAALDNSIRKEIEDFPGIESPSIMEYVNKLPFQGAKSRARIAEILESKKSQDLGAPNVQRILDEMRSDQYDGLRIGDVVLAIELTPGAHAVKLGEQGTLKHPSYQYALRGRVIGRFARPINISSIFDDFYAQRRADGKPELGDRRAFDLAKPVQEITDAIASRIPGTPYNSFRSPRHAQLIKMATDDKWRSSEQTVKAGGISPAAFIDALNASPAKLALDRYTLKSLQEKLEAGDMSIYQLGDAQVFFGIKQGDPASAYGQDPAAFGFGPNEKTLSLVLNNERKTGGMADAIVMKSLQLGVTALDCFAVKSQKHPAGMLPELYESYGFESVGSLPFDPQFYSKTELADLKKYWKSIGWDESLGLPEIVLMKWKGNDELRTKSLRDLVDQGGQSFRGSSQRIVRDTRGRSGSASNKRNKPKRRSGQGDAGAGAGSQGTARGGVRLSRGFLGAYDELLSMSPEELRNLGIK